MAIGRTYNVDIGTGTGITLGSYSAGTEYILMTGTTTGEFNISAVRVATYSGASASYPSNGTLTWRIRRISSAPTTAILTGTGTAAPVSQSTTAALSAWLYSNTSNATATVASYGNVLWGQTTPATAGANWGEWFTPGFELNVTNGSLALTYEFGAAGTTSIVSLIPELVISE